MITIPPPSRIPLNPSLSDQASLSAPLTSDTNVYASPDDDSTEEATSEPSYLSAQSAGVRMDDTSWAGSLPAPQGLYDPSNEKEYV